MANDQILTPEAHDLVEEYRALKRREGRARWLSALVGAGLAVMVVFGVYSVPVSVADTATQQKDQATQQKNQEASSKQVLANQATTVSDKTLQQCLFGDDVTRKTLTEAGLCAEAQQLRDYIAKAIPAPVPGTNGINGQAGANGKNGEPGRGISSTSIVDGRFLVTYTDGATEDKGSIQGPKGENGTTGKGITGSTINASGHLVLTYSDGTTADVGQVVGTNGKNGTNGKDGRGISSTGIVNGHLIVTYTDGDTTDLGPLPQGPKGNDGQPPMGWTGTTSSGKTYTCARATNFDYSNPQYTCTAPTSPPSSTPTP